MKCSLLLAVLLCAGCVKLPQREPFYAHVVCSVPDTKAYWVTATAFGYGLERAVEFDGACYKTEVKIKVVYVPQHK